MTATPHRRDHLWVLFLIAVCVLAEVWASWVGIGAISGFPTIGRIPTDWVLAMAMEAYWGYALYAWLVASPGPRSRAMAMWSCGVVFTFSLIGQVLYHEITAPAGTPFGKRFVIGFVTSLPVIVLALIAVLIHLRHMDREEAAKAARKAAREAERVAAEAAAADERTMLRAELETVMAVKETLASELEAARGELVQAVAKTEALTRKLAGNGTRKRGTATGRKQGREPAPATAPEDMPDVDREALVLRYLADGKSASAAGRLAGLSDSRGRQIARDLAKAAPQGPDSKEAA